MAPDTSGKNHTQLVDQESNGFVVDIKDLRRLMECRRTEGIAWIQEKYNDVNGLCKKLKTSPTEGNDTGRTFCFDFLV